MRPDGGGVVLLASVAAFLLFVPTAAEVTEFEKACEWFLSFICEQE